MKPVLDQCAREIYVPERPERIVSLVPSQTELLAYLGLEKEVCGITKFCIHPTGWQQVKTRVGGTKHLNLEQIRQLRPDLIVANKEENVKEQVEELSREFPVWVSDVNNLEDALDMIKKVGGITGTTIKAAALAEEIERRFLSLAQTVDKPRTAYLIWRDPFMTAGADTFIHSMLEASGFDNLFRDRSRYPVIRIEDLIENKCELLLLSTEPYPFKQQHIDELQARLPDTRILLADGELFSWYGSRLLQSPAYFEKLRGMIF